MVVECSYLQMYTVKTNKLCVNMRSCVDIQIVNYARRYIFTAKFNLMKKIVYICLRHFKLLFMIKKTKVIFITLLLCSQTAFGGLNSAPSDSVKYEPKPYVGIQVGSFGGGFQFAYPISPMITLRAGGSFCPSIERTFLGTEYGATTTTDILFKTAGGGIIADFSLLKNKPGIRLSAGAIYNGMTTTANRSYYYESEDLDLGDLMMVFTPQLRVNPYVGVAIGNLKNSKHLFFSIEGGVLYQGKPQVEFTGEGHIAPTANESNTSIIENNIKSWQWYPYMNIQLNYKL